MKQVPTSLLKLRRATGFCYEPYPKSMSFSYCGQKTIWKQLFLTVSTPSPSKGDNIYVSNRHPSRVSLLLKVMSKGSANFNVAVVYTSVANCTTFQTKRCSVYILRHLNAVQLQKDCCLQRKPFT